MMFRGKVWAGVVLALIAGLTLPVSAQEQSAESYERIVTRAIDFLGSKGQAADGSYNAAAGPGVTALVTTAILRHGRSPEDPVVAKSLKYLEGFIREDGGIYALESTHKNYETCLALLCFA